MDTWTDKQHRQIHMVVERIKNLFDGCEEHGPLGAHPGVVGVRGDQTLLMQPLKRR